MAVTDAPTSSKMVARLSGLVTYSDGSHAQFAVHRDHQGNLSYNDKAASTEALKQAHAHGTWLESMFALAGSRGTWDAGAVTFNPAAPDTAKTVTGLVAELSGRISITPTQPFKKTWEDFIFQYDSNNSDTGLLGAMIPEGDVGLEGDTGTTAWHKAAVAFEHRLDDMFTDLGVSIT